MSIEYVKDVIDRLNEINKKIHNAYQRARLLPDRHARFFTDEVEYKLQKAWLLCGAYELTACHFEKRDMELQITEPRKKMIEQLIEELEVLVYLDQPKSSG